MNVADTERFSQRLLQLKEEFPNIAEDSRDAARTVTLAQTSVGRLSHVDAMQSQQMAK